MLVLIARTHQQKKYCFRHKGGQIYLSFSILFLPIAIPNNPIASDIAMRTIRYCEFILYSLRSVCIYVNISLWVMLCFPFLFLSFLLFLYPDDNRNIFNERIE